jgi:hypothetical protein
MLTPTRLTAQVFQVQGGGSSLFQGYGGVLNMWGNGFEASLGIGYLDGLRVGASARRLMGGRDTLRLGNDLLPFDLATDIFGGGGTVFAQGASYQMRRGRTQLWTFGGASAIAQAAPYFAAQMPSRAMFYSRARHDVSRTLSLEGHAIFTERQSAIASAVWKPTASVRSSVSAGVGSNSPYGALSLVADRRTWEAKLAFVGFGDHFRRTSAPMPLQTELERENALLMWKPIDGWSLGVGRQHFRQDSSFQGIAQRAALNQVTATARIAQTALSTGVLVSEAGTRPNISSYLNARRDITSRLQSELYLLQVWRPLPARNTTPVLILRELISPQFSLLQSMTWDQGRTSVAFGGTLNAGLSSISLDYQVAHSPYLTQDPFVQSMGVNARLYVAGFNLSVGSFVTPDGRIHYSAQGSRFAYRGVSSNGSGWNDGAKISDYVVSGRVEDEDGNPIDGASLEVGTDAVYTDSRGRFFVRKSGTRTVPLRVILNDFLAPGNFEVVRAPTTVTPAREGKGEPVVIVVRRVPQRSTPQGAAIR